MFFLFQPLYVFFLKKLHGFLDFFILNAVLALSILNFTVCDFLLFLFYEAMLNQLF